MSQDDPTDSALAWIASILDRPIDKSEFPRAEEISVAPQPPQHTPADADGYVKFGPGPLDAIRFKWTARHAGDDNYFVDETIGDNSRKMTSGPMPKQEAISFIDERESDARQRFDALKREMTGRATATTPATAARRGS